MYTKQETAVLKQEFWTALGRYLSPIPSADGNKINWINYKTGVRNIYFRMGADNNRAFVCIEISHPDEETRLKFFQHFQRFPGFFHMYEAVWNWEKNTEMNGRHISRIFQVIRDVNLFERSDWPMLISFFKTRMLELDKFWSENKVIFEII
ncbi:MAG: DUF4268 domain-containing protein [Ferruginibacter sp.]